jgi:tetratricopeptide (TPR) repeat protein
MSLCRRKVRPTAREFYNDQRFFCKNTTFAGRGERRREASTSGNMAKNFASALMPRLKFLPRRAALALCLWLASASPAAFCLAVQDAAQDEAAARSQVGRLIDAGRLNEAKERLTAVVAARGETAVTRYLAARLLFKERRFVESIKLLERVLAESGGGQIDDGAREELHAEASALMGLNLVLLDRLDLAEPFLKEAARLRPCDRLTRFHLGMLYYTTSRFAAAESELREAVRLGPEFAPAWDTLGLALEELGRDEAAIEAYRRAIELGARQRLRDPSPHLNLGKFLVSKGRYEESLPPLRKALEFDGHSAEAAYQLGKALNKLGRAGDAVKALTQAARSDPAYAEPHYLLSRIYLGQGRAEEAEREMRLFQELQRKKSKK